jgi:hypothetical protein
MNSLYTTAIAAINSGAVNWPTDTIQAVLVSNAYIPNINTDQFYSTIVSASAVIGSPETITGISLTNGILFANTVVFPTVTSGSTVTYVVVFRYSGSNSTSQLLCLFDTMYGLPYSTNGANIPIAWPYGAIFSGTGVL